MLKKFMRLFFTPSADSRNTNVSCATPDRGNTNVEDEFLDAIRRAPDDDTPRLAYADWLDQRRDPRGEFIRVQCALASSGKHECIYLAHDPVVYGSDYAVLAQREVELVQQYGAQWAQPFLPLACRRDEPFRTRRNEPGSLDFPSPRRFRRGFIESVVTEPQMLANAIDAIRRSREPIRQLWVRTNRPLDYCKWQIDRLPIGDAIARMLADAADLNWIESVHLRYGLIGPAGAEALAGANSLDRISTLDLHANQIGTDGVRFLARSHLMERLRTLNLGHNGIAAEGARVLADSTFINGLKILNLSSNDLGDSGALALASSPNTKILERLYLSNNDITETGYFALRQSPCLASLRMLQLKKNPITFLSSRKVFDGDRIWNVTHYQPNFGACLRAFTAVPNTALSKSEDGRESGNDIEPKERTELSMGADMDDRKRQPLSFDEQVELLVGVTDFWEYSDSAKLTASYLDKRFGSTAISPAVLEAALNKVDLDDRGALMKTLFVARPADFRTKIVSLLKDTEVDYKYAAIIGLLRLDEKQALKELDDLCSRVSDGLVASPLDRDGDPLFELGNVSDDVIEFAPDRYVELLLSLRVNKAE